MPRTGGTYTLPSPANPVITGTTISSADHNATLSDIASALTDSLPVDGSVAMDGPLQLTDGTSVAPALAFGSEPSLGIYRAGTGDLRFQIAASNVLKLTGTTVTAPIGLTVTQDTADTAALTGTGNGTGYGADFSGGSTSGIGVHGLGGAPNGAGGAFAGTGSGAGITGVGGATSGAIGGNFTGGSTNGLGAKGTGVGTGAGVTGNGGATSGKGAVFTGGAPNGEGLNSTGTGNGAGGVFYNSASSSSAAIEGRSASTAAGAFLTNSSTGVALQVHSGHASFTGGNPSSSTAYSNTLTPANIVKAWCYFTVSGGTATLQDGFNITSVAVTSGVNVTVTLASAMSSANFGVTATAHNTGGGGGIIPVGLHVNSKTTTTVVIAGHKESGGSAIASINTAADAYGVTVSVIGAQ